VNLLHRPNKPNTCHRAHFQHDAVQRGAYVTRQRTHLLFCIQTGKHWRYCHEKRKTHLGVCCMYLLNCPDNSLEGSWRIARAQTATFTSVFWTHWHAPKVGIQKANVRAIQALMSLWKGFWRISEFKAQAVLTETVRNVTIISHLIFKTPGYTELQTVCVTRPANQVNIRYSHY